MISEVLNSEPEQGLNQKYLVLLMISVMVIIVYDFTGKENQDEYIAEKQSRSIDEVFEMRNNIVKRSCSFIEQLNTANKIASIDELKGRATGKQTSLE